MSVREEALGWLSRRLIVDESLQGRLGMGPIDLDTREGANRVLASRLYPPEESWTKAWSWWHVVAPEKLEGDGDLVLLCQNSGGRAFELLAVPRLWLRENRERLAFVAAKERYHLFLSAERGERFREKREAGLDFGRWLVR